MWLGRGANATSGLSRCTPHFLAQGSIDDRSQVNETQFATSVGPTAKRNSSSAEAAELGAVGATPWEATVSEATEKNAGLNKERSWVLRR